VLPTTELVQAWLLNPDRATAASLAMRLRSAGAVDRVRMAVATDEIPPDATLVVLMPQGDRLPARTSITAVRAVAPHATVLVPVVNVTIAEVVELLSGGADAVVDLEAHDRDLAHGVRAAARDRSYVPREHQAAAVAALARRPRQVAETRARIARLSPKEREILDLLADGIDRASIATRFHEPVSLVRARIDRAKAKLGVASQREAIAMLGAYLNRSR
jgi:DNA-binding NarL/FixJ family response regulator